MAGPTDFEVQITLKPIFADPTPPALINADINRDPLIITQRQVYSNGVEVNMSEGFINRFVERLQMTQMFSIINYYQSFQKADKYFNVCLKVYETNDIHAGKNLARVGASALTFGLSTLVYHGKTDFTSEFFVTVQRSDGQKKEYHAKSAGTCTYGTFSNKALAGGHLGATVTNLNLNSIANQFLNDKEFYNF